MMQESQLLELSRIIERNYPETAMFMPVILPRVAQDRVFLAELQCWIDKNAQKREV